MIQRFFLVPVVLILILVGIGCPKDELGGGLVVSQTSIDFGKEKNIATLEVWKTFTSSSIGPIFAEATVPWIVINNCTSPSDNCVSSGPLDRIKIEVKVDREKTLLGNNSGTIIVRATNAPTVEVPITLTDLIFVDFDATNKFSTVKDPVRFVNQSSVFGADIEIKRYIWDFGDGDTSNDKNPVHYYSQPGKYTVSLTVETTHGTERRVKEGFINVSPKELIVDFTVTPQVAFVGEEVQFVDNSVSSAEPIVKRVWDFGDGNKSEEVNPKHVYITPGVYNVTLTVVTSFQEKSLTKPGAVTIQSGAPPTAKFSVSQVKPFVNIPVQFYDLSQPGSAPITEWIWDFGDENIVRYTDSDPTHEPQYAFSRIGVQNVRLTVTNRFGSSSFSMPLDVIYKPPTAKFRVVSPCAIVGSETKFIDQSVAGSSDIVEWIWDFGDGFTSNEQSPTHVYMVPGSYNVKLKVRSLDGSESEYERSNCVNVRSYNSPLDLFVNEIDPEYSWTTPVVYPINLDFGPITTRIATAYITRMTSQAWRSDSEIYSGRFWRHNLTIVVPERLTTDTALLYVDGGSINSNPPNESMRLFLGKLAALSGCTIVHLDNVPSQPIVFMDDYDADTGEVVYSRDEDAIIAYSYDKFMDEYKRGNYDYKWPVLLAMAKSAVRAMDTTQAILEERAPLKFIITGASKRGWTTWLAGLTDCRIEAIAPLVIDVLNMDKQMEHHKKVYGYWAPSIYEYAQMNVFDRLIGEEGLPEEAVALLRIVDPYEYIFRMQSLPKFIMNSSCDQFFVPDSSRWYYDDLLGEKWLNYVPNVSHNIVDEFDLESESIQSLFAWFLAKTQGVPLPRYRWIRETENSLRVEVDNEFISSIQEVKLWKCTNPYARDFRKGKLDFWDLRYEKIILSPRAPGVYSVEIPTPYEGWTAYFIQIKFNNPAHFSTDIPGIEIPPLTFTTPIFVIPDQYPTYVSEKNSVGPYPLLVLRGSPYEMGYSYGNFMQSEIRNHINYVYTYLSNRFGISESTLDDVWNVQKNMLDERIKKEIQGMADATGISYDDLGKLQLVEFLSTYSTNNDTNVRASGAVLWSDATNIISYWGSSPVVLTYSYNRKLYSPDLPPEIEHFPQQYYPVILFYIPDQGFPHALITFAGLVVGRVGVNIAGISYGDIPVLGEVPVKTENMLFTLRKSLYDSNRLKDTIDLVKLESKGRWHKYLLADGRYEKRGAKIRIDNTGLFVIRDNSPFDEYNPRIKKYVVYAGHDPVTADSIYNILNRAISLFDTFHLANIGAISGYNLMNTVIDATSFTAYVTYAFETFDASTQIYYQVDFQSLLP